MDPNSTPFPGKSRPSKSRATRKPLEAPPSDELPISRPRCVFGTVRNVDIPAITVTHKPVIKPSVEVSQNQPKSTKIRNFPKKAKTKSKKKSVCFPDQVREKSAKNVEAVNIAALRTPVASTQSRLEIPGTPYHSAENCSKCRFDRLETSSYWLGQIKLAESVGKHFISAAFFRLAFESKAEPVRSLRVELRRYLARHGCLSEQTEWREASVAYGMLKDGSSTGAVVQKDSAIQQPVTEGTIVRTWTNDSRRNSRLKSRKLPNRTRHVREVWNQRFLNLILHSTSVFLIVIALNSLDLNSVTSKTSLVVCVLVTRFLFKIVEDYFRI